MYSGEREDWIKSIFETNEQLGRLVEQFRALNDERLTGMIGRMESLQDNLYMIQKWLEKQRSAG